MAKQARSSPGHFSSLQEGQGLLLAHGALQWTGELLPAGDPLARLGGRLLRQPPLRSSSACSMWDRTTAYTTRDSPSSDSEAGPDQAGVQTLEHGFSECVGESCRVLLLAPDVGVPMPKPGHRNAYACGAL